MIIAAIIVLGAVFVGRVLTRMLRKRKEDLEAASLPDELEGDEADEDVELADELIGELAETLDRTADELEAARSVRMEIIRCYRRMCRAFSRAGHPRAPAITPREFWDHARTRFPPVSDAMRQLTVLFEEAVFSTHPMGEQARDRARKQLARTMKELEAWKAQRNEQQQAQSMQEERQELGSATAM